MKYAEFLTKADALYPDEFLINLNCRRGVVRQVALNLFRDGDNCSALSLEARRQLISLDERWCLCFDE